MKRRNQSPHHLLLSNSGSLIVIALVGLVILSASFYTGISQLRQTQKHIRMVVIKQQMIAAESRLNNLLLQPTSYEIVPPSTVATFKENLLEQFKIKVTGARCASGTPFCGISIKKRMINNTVTLPYWDVANSKFNGVIFYSGQDASLQELDIEISVPREVVQLEKYFCSVGRPFMAGFKANGELICNPLPEPSECTEIGGYIKNISNNLVATCGNFGKLIACDSDSYISPPGPSWNGEIWHHPGCTPRIDPYSNPSLRPE